MRQQFEHTPATFSRSAIAGGLAAEKRHTRRGVSCGLFALFTSAAVSCGPTSQSSNVVFGAADAVGDWQAASSASDAGVAAEATTTEGTSDSVAQRANAAGRAAPALSDAADGGTFAEPAGYVASSLSFQVTTSPVGGRYQPKNVGAIWIEDSSAHVVKTLQVWASARRRYLTGYLAAMAGSSIDVTASATLSRHQTHSVSWDLKDRSGASVAPGTYRVHMELTDSNQTGRSNVVELDTSAGPSTLTPSDAPSFSAIKLELK